jgi:pentafunctional AROM polypeptide
LTSKKRLGISRIIGSIHQPSATPPSSSPDRSKQLTDLFAKCYINNGRDIDVVKVCIMARDRTDVMELLRAASTVSLPYAPHGGPVMIRVPIIALSLGDVGRFSRVVNRTLTPVTHPLLPTLAAPGQLSVTQIQSLRQSLSLVTARQYWLFGSPITHSPSPILHNAGFNWLHLPYVYGKHEATTVDEIKSIVNQTQFGGASVTIPLKEKVHVLCTRISESAKRIGAINTLIRNSVDGSIVGDNTDWLGLYRPLDNSLPMDRRQGCALVLGAGGTSRAAIYALLQLGFTPTNIMIYNPRTPARSTSLAAHFGVTAINNLSTIRQSVSATSAFFWNETITQL